MFYDPPFQIPTINFIAFNAISIAAEISAEGAVFSFGTEFQLATGESYCESWTEAECMIFNSRFELGVTSDG